MTAVYALDATPMVSRPTGIGRYVRELVHGLAPLLEFDERLVLHAGVARFNPLLGHAHDALDEAAALPGVRVAKQWVPLSVSYGLARRTGRPRVETFTGPVDVYHGTNYLIPPTRGARRVASIHDLSILLEPDSVSPETARRFERAVRFAAREAEAVVTLSEASAREIRERLDVEPARLHVIPPAVTGSFATANDPGDDRSRLAHHPVLAPLADARPFALFVGTTIPRKNVPQLVRAWDAARTDQGLPHRLVLAGAPGHDEDAVRAAIDAASASDDVLRAGYVDEATLGALYRLCDGLVMPSRDEGFGLPALEALSCGRPVLAARRGALPEVCGDAALYVDPDDSGAFAAALARLLQDDDVRRHAAASGPERAARFGRARSAEAHIRLYRSLR